MKSKNTNEIYDIKIEDQTLRLKLLAPLVTKNIKSYETLKKKFSGQKCNAIDCDFSAVSSYDTYLVVLILWIRDFTTKNGMKLKETGVTPDMERFISILDKKDHIAMAQREHHSMIFEYFNNIGSVIIVVFSDLRFFVTFLGDLIIKMLRMIVFPFGMRWKDFPFHFNQAGVNAVPIVLLIIFLIGVITGYQGALQLKRFGADIFIANLIGISISRELAPLMTAIIVAGRSGSAYAAEIGTMKVAEEVDALSTMGFDIVKFLVLPRVFAVMIAMPILTLLADVAGIAGGLLAAITTLNITVAGYMNQLQMSLGFTDVFTGIGKSIIFGFLISTVGCFRGLQVRGGAESVGRYTTASVVTGIFLIILSDALFTFIFQTLGI